MFTGQGFEFSLLQNSCALFIAQPSLYKTSGIFSFVPAKFFLRARGNFTTLLQTKSHEDEKVQLDA